MLEPTVRLRQAVKEGNLLVVKRLLNRFPDLLENIDPENGWTSLHYAAFNGRYLVCVHLISLGHDKVEVLKTFKRNTAVHLSLMNGHEQTTHLLLQHFPKELQMKGDCGFTPLHTATIGDYNKCCELLLGMGADINAVDAMGNNALHLAMKYGSLQCIQLLIKRKVDAEAKNHQNLKPVDVAASFQVEKFYQSIMKNPTKYSSSSLEPYDTDSLVTPTISSQGVFQEEELVHSPLKSTIAVATSSFAKLRNHSNSLPPLPSVTTARRASNASSLTRSPIPRSSISLGFTGSNTNSYVYSPAQSLSQHSSGGSMNGALSIKPPGFSIQISSSPVLYSPTTTFHGAPSFSSIREDANTTGLGVSNVEKPNETVQSISSTPSMTSINSHYEKISFEQRTRANSSLVTPNFIPLSKSRSNSESSKKSIVIERKEPGKISPPSTSTEKLSRVPTVSESSVGEEEHHSLMSTFDIDHSLRSKFSDSYRQRTRSSSSIGSLSSNNTVSTGSKGPILNIPIANLNRRKDE